MRDYGLVHNTFWSSPTTADLDSDAKVLALYLLTSPHTTTSGAFRLPDAYACEDLRWDAKRFRNSLETISRAGFVKVDEATRWVWIVNFAKFNKPANPNIRKAAIKQVQGMPESVQFRSEVVESLTTGETVSEPLRNLPSPSPSPSPMGVQGVSIPLDDGTEHPVTEAEVAEYRTAYPRIDVAAELRKARAWSIANPSKRKTRKGVARFLNNWLSGANDEIAKRGNVVSLASVPGGGRREL